ncbi:hypothetical protein FACS1894105_10850 [Clostridia bacterium]|nr:hypothetical protein FACS1894105_10850 [Clostridia bacterium]
MFLAPGLLESIQTNLAAEDFLTAFNRSIYDKITEDGGADISRFNEDFTKAQMSRVAHMQVAAQNYAVNASANLLYAIAALKAEKEKAEIKSTDIREKALGSNEDFVNHIRNKDNVKSSLRGEHKKGEHE